MKGLSKREKCIIGGTLALCCVIVVIVVMVFMQLGNYEEVQLTSTPGENTTTPTGVPTITPIPTDVIVIPETDGPVFFGISSSISVDCIDPRFVKNEVVDQLFYLGYSQQDYTVTEAEDCITIKVRLQIDKDAFTDLYTRMLTLIYDCNVTQHLENGVSVDKNGMDSDDQYSYLTMSFYWEDVE